MGTLSGGPVDRRPFTALMSLYGAKLAACPLTTYYNDSQAYVEGQCCVWEAFQPDIVFAPFLIAGYGEVFGGTLRYFEHMPPNLLTPGHTSAESFLSRELPSITNNTRLRYFLKAQEELKKTLGSKAILVSIALSPVDLPVMIFGLERWLEIILFSPEIAARVMEKTAVFFKEWVQALQAAGADAIALPAVFLNPMVVTRQLIEHTAIPIMSSVFAELSIPLVLHHVGGPFVKYLDLYACLPNVAGVVLDHKDSLEDARKKIPEQMNVFCGLDGGTLHFLPLETIEEKCKAILSNRHQDSHFIFATTGPDIALETPKESVLAMKQAVEDEGNAEGYA